MGQPAKAVEAKCGCGIVAIPELRRVKRAHANQSASRGHSARADQHEVWNEVSSRLSEHGVASPSAALSDVFRAKRPAD